MPGMGSLTVYLNANSSGLERGLSKASGMLKKFSVAAAGYMAFNALKQLAVESVNLAAAQEKAENLMARTLQNTSGMADFTVGELKRYAAEVQNMSIFGDEKVMEAQTRLMQMNAVTGEAFKQTRSVAVDIASATGEDLTATMQNLGRALQDPIRGMRLLRQYGVDPAMKDQIEARIKAEGKEAGQMLILADLQRRYAGAAVEAANTMSGAMKRNQNALSDLKESFGFVLNEIFDISGTLDSTRGLFAEWAQYLRDHAAEIGYGFRSVWIDIKYGAMQLYAYVAPIMNQIYSTAEAAIKNVTQFYQAIPKLLNGEDFRMNFYQPAMTLIEDYQNLWKTLDDIDRAQASARRELDRGFSLKLNKQAEQNIARGAAKGAAQGAAEGTVKGMQQAAKQKFDAPSAIMGSEDAWRIILAAAASKGGTVAAAKGAALAVSSPAVPTSAPAAAARPAAPKSRPAAPAAPAAQTFAAPSLFKTSVTSDPVRLTSSDLNQSVRDLISFINPALLATELIRAAATPGKYSSAVKIAGSPQAAGEDWLTRAAMVYTSLTDRRNYGVKGDPARYSSAISREEDSAARAEQQKRLADNSQKQLRVLEKIAVRLGFLQQDPANLQGGF